MSDDRLGGFEELILLAVANLEGDAYAVPIKELISRHRTVSMGAIYSALDRLERKGFVQTWMGSVTPVQGGKRKRLYRISGLGKEALIHARRTRELLWSGLVFDTGADRSSS